MNDSLVFNSHAGEIKGQLPTTVALTKKIQSKEQRIMIIGDVDCFSMGELETRRRGVNSYNFNFIMGIFNWLSYNEAPVDVTRPDAIDKTFNLNWESGNIIRSILKWGIPSLIFLYAMVFLIRRKRK